MVCSLENIASAHNKAKKGKRHYAEVRMVDRNPQKYFAAIQQMLVEKSFVNSDYTILVKKEGLKQREIWRLPYYPDRIIHHCVVNILEPIWMRTYIRDTYAALPGRGIHDGAARVRMALRDLSGTRYCLKMDVRKFYQSVDHVVLKKLVRHKIKDPDVLWLLDLIINSAPGVPIGNYTSQHFGNLMLTVLDHWLKEKLKVRYYFRYCDDMVLLSDSKDQLHGWRRLIEFFLADILKLELKKNWQVFPVTRRGIDFLGYRFFHGYTLVRKSIVSRFKRKFRRGNQRSMAAYNGWFVWANTYNLRTKYNWRTGHARI